MRKEVILKGSEKIVKLEFDSTTEMLDYCEGKQNAPGFYSKSSHSVEDCEWIGTDSWEEAERLCKYGDFSDKFKEFVKLKDDLDIELEQVRTRYIQVHNFVGYYPDIPRYLQGHPLNMIDDRLIEDDIPDRTVEIYYNASALAHNSAEAMFHRGVICLSLIDHLENLGYRVNLHVLTASKCRNEYHVCVFDLKNVDERADLQSLYFPLTNPSFLRRFVFRLREIETEIDSEWRFGYGRTCDKCEIEKLFTNGERKQIIFEDPQTMGIKGRNIVKDMNNCFEHLNLQSIIPDHKPEDEQV